MTAALADAETLAEKYPLYHKWISENDCERLRNILYKLGFGTKWEIDKNLPEMWIIATGTESDIVHFERYLTEDFEAGGGGVWTGLVLQATQRFKRKPIRDGFYIPVTITMEEAWRKAGLPVFDEPPDSRKGQRRRDEIPESAIPLLQTLPREDQRLFYLGYVAKLSWFDGSSTLTGQ